MIFARGFSLLKFSYFLPYGNRAHKLAHVSNVEPNDGIKLAGIPMDVNPSTGKMAALAIEPPLAAAKQDS